jgi:lysophospholipase L1-like esterase
MEKKSRRNFIKNMSFAGIAASAFPFKAYSSGRILPVKILNSNSVILFQGDSITDGNRGRTKDLNHIMGHGYACNIAGRIGADCPHKNYLFYNRGISGNKIVDLEKRWQNDVLDLNPNILSILIGVNDSASMVDNWPPKVSVDQFARVYDKLLSKTRDALPDVTFVLCEPFIMPGARTNKNWSHFKHDIAERQMLVLHMAKKYNAIHVPFQDMFEKACRNTPVEYWIWDGVHPTVAGHELMARQWLKHVEDFIQF